MVEKDAVSKDFRKQILRLFIWKLGIWKSAASSATRTHSRASKDLRSPATLVLSRSVATKSQRIG
jgi:hypothetical protein